MPKDPSAPAAWAIRKALALCGITATVETPSDAAVTAFARYVEANEAPPPDPPAERGPRSHRAVLRINRHAIGRQGSPPWEM